MSRLRAALPSIRAIEVAPERARTLLVVAFALTGVINFSWMARLPSVKVALDLDTATLGLVFLIGSAGALTTVVGGGTALRRWGSAKVYGIGAVLVIIGLSAMGIAAEAGSLAGFVAGVIVQGLGGAAMNIVVNVESARVERALERPVIPQFHAGFSAGAVVGSMLGAACAGVGVGVLTQFVLAGVIGGLLRLLVLVRGLVLPLTADEVFASTTSRRAPTAWKDPRALLVGLVVFAAVVSEGAANNWLAVAVVDGLGHSEALGGVVMGVFIASMLVLRLVGTWLLQRLGRVNALRLSIGLVVLGVTVFAFTDDIRLAFVGAIAWGAGAALCFPICVSALSDDPLLAQGRVAVLSAISTVAGLVAPPALGLVAGAVGVQHSLLVVAAVVAASLLLSGKVSLERTGPVVAPLRSAVLKAPAER